jgi:hypothetical protein
MDLDGREPSIQTQKMKIKFVSGREQNRQKVDVSFSSTSFVLSRFRVLLSDGSSKTLPRKNAKNRVEASFCQNRKKKNRVQINRQKI